MARSLSVAMAVTVKKDAAMRRTIKKCRIDKIVGQKKPKS